MSQPTPYDRIASFSNIQAQAPAVPLPGNTVDAEFNAIKATLDGILANIELIQRDDGALANASVGLDQLSEDIEVGWTAPQVWVTATAYVVGNTLFHGSGFYRVLIAHTAGVFATDLSGGKLELIVDLSAIAVVSASQVANTPAGSISAVTVQAAIDELASEKAATSHTHPSSAISDSTAAGRALLTAATLAAQQAILGFTALGANPGDIKPTAALTLQSGWYWCNGATKNRTTDSALFAAITITQTGTTANTSPIITALSDTSNMSPGMFISGTNIPATATILYVDSATQITISANATGAASSSLCIAPHGVGDGSATFNLPDYSGRTLIGRETMGGVAAANIGQVSTTITTSAASPTTTVASATGLHVGMYVTSAKVPSGTKILTINGTTVTLDTNASAISAGVAVRFSPTRDAQTLGAAGGELGHISATTEMSAHSHGITDPGHTHTSPIDKNVGVVGAGAATDGARTNNVTTGNSVTGITINSAGGGLAHNNVQPSKVVNWIIKA